MTQDLSETEVEPGQEARPGTRVDATEEEARELAEAAREAEWDRPSFAKGLYLGRFDLSLVHPHPRGAADDVERGEAFLAELRAVCEKLDGQRIEREDRIPDEYLAALSDIGAFGMKIPRQYGGLGLTMAYYGKALMLIGSVHPSHRRTRVGPPVDRRTRAGQDVRHRRAEAAVPAPLCRRRDHRVPAHRARRRLRPRPDVLDGHPLRGRRRPTSSTA